MTEGSGKGCLFWGLLTIFLSVVSSIIVAYIVYYVTEPLLNDLHINVSIPVNAVVIVGAMACGLGLGLFAMGIYAILIYLRVTFGWALD